jgi:hypothetical protein
VAPPTPHCDALIIGAGSNRSTLDQATKKFTEEIELLLIKIFPKSQIRVFVDESTICEEFGVTIFAAVLKALLPTSSGVLSRMKGRLSFGYPYWDAPAVRVVPEGDRADLLREVAASQLFFEQSIRQNWQTRLSFRKPSTTLRPATLKHPDTGAADEDEDSGLNTEDEEILLGADPAHLLEEEEGSCDPYVELSTLCKPQVEDPDRQVVDVERLIQDGIVTKFNPDHLKDTARVRARIHEFMSEKEIQAYMYTASDDEEIENASPPLKHGINSSSGKYMQSPIA